MIVGILQMAINCSADLRVAMRKSNWRTGPEIIPSGLAAKTSPAPFKAFSVSCRAAIGIAQCAKSAGRSIALESVHNSTDGAHNLEIARLLFELQRLIIQRLQQFLRGLKKQLAHFSAAFIRKLSHSITSTF